MKGMKIWVSTLIEYDQFGNATVLRSFAKPAMDSALKGGLGGKKAPPKKSKNKKEDKEVKDIW